MAAEASSGCNGNSIVQLVYQPRVTDVKKAHCWEPSLFVKDMLPHQPNSGKNMTRLLSYCTTHSQAVHTNKNWRQWELGHQRAPLPEKHQQQPSSCKQTTTNTLLAAAQVTKTQPEPSCSKNSSHCSSCCPRPTAAAAAFQSLIGLSCQLLLLLTCRGSRPGTCSLLSAWGCYTAASHPHCLVGVRAWVGGVDAQHDAAQSNRALESDHARLLKVVKQALAVTDADVVAYT